MSSLTISSERSPFIPSSLSQEKTTRFPRESLQRFSPEVILGLMQRRGDLDNPLSSYKIKGTPSRGEWHYFKSPRRNLPSSSLSSKAPILSSECARSEKINFFSKEAIKEIGCETVILTIAHLLKALNSSGFQEIKIGGIPATALLPILMINFNRLAPQFPAEKVHLYGLGYSAEQKEFLNLSIEALLKSRGKKNITITGFSETNLFQNINLQEKYERHIGTFDIIYNNLSLDKLSELKALLKIGGALIFKETLNIQKRAKSHENLLSEEENNYYKEFQEIFDSIHAPVEHHLPLYAICKKILQSGFHFYKRNISSSYQPTYVFLLINK
ncbi:hypothetical protein DB42_AQ00240 [Neochlamydia sp. EPS4]|uniref:hypothetical protein n=1 Tax=Neochlamydia sp. EPS4 TaxID=1478175 RepID=UPI000582B78D|nr:hypothetical protein [Neochlamydia sp. EPS4]KIC75044.1 hypothetical protein DB42_AQ00240 [Neochlamydia sp. EPS4]